MKLLLLELKVPDGTTGSAGWYRAAAEGVQFPNGKIVLQWLGAHAFINIYESPEDVIAIHGHDTTKLTYHGGDEE